MLDVIYEDNHLIAVNKPVGVLVQGDETGDEPLSESVKQYIKTKYKKPGAVFLGVVHRLDRPVSGVVVFARTSKALSRMNALFQKRETRKTYLALTDGHPKDEEVLKHWLTKDEVKNKAAAHKGPHPEGKESELTYKRLMSREGIYLLQVEPLTGRPHQIRVQLSSIGCPLVGDVKYGSKRSHPEGGIFLHAYKLSFTHPVSQVPVTLQAPPPDIEFWNYFYPSLP